MEWDQQISAAADDEFAARARLHEAVTAARRDGHSWTAIGAVLGITKQAAQQRFGQ